jgi:hypothetical protein
VWKIIRAIYKTKNVLLTTRYLEAQPCD